MDDFFLDNHETHQNDNPNAHLLKELDHIQFFKQSVAMAKLFHFLKIESLKPSSTLIGKLQQTFDGSTKANKMFNTRFVEDDRFSTTTTTTTPPPPPNHYNDWLLNQPDPANIQDLRGEIKTFFVDGLDKTPTSVFYGDIHDNLNFLFQKHPEMGFRQFVKYGDDAEAIYPCFTTDQVLYQRDQRFIYLFRSDKVFVSVDTANNMKKKVYFQLTCESFETISIIE